MAINRYNPSEVRAITGADGIAHTAQAGYEQSVANTYGVLADKLSQWQNIAAKEKEAQSTARGQEEALADVREDGGYKPTGDFTAYDKAYKDAAHTAYSLKTQQDAKEYADTLEMRLAQDHKTRNNPEAFADAYERYANTVVESSPDEYGKIVAKQAFTKYGADKHSSISKIHYKEVRDRDKATYISGVKLLEDDFIKAFASGDEQKVLEARDQLSALNSRGIQEGWTDENSIKVYSKEIVKKAYTEKTLSNFGGTVKEYREFKKNDDRVLNFEEKRALEKKMISMIDDDVKLSDRQDKKEKEDIERTYRLKSAEYRKAWVYGGLTQEQLDISLASDEITQTAYDDLSKRISDPGVQNDNTQELLTIKRNMLNVTEDEILNANLTNTTKIRLIDERSKLLRSENGAWASTIDGRQAVRRINRKFNIVEGGILNFGNGALKDYDKVYRNFYNSVMALPIEQREFKALELADKAISDYNNEKAEITAKRKADKLALQEQERLAQEKEDNASIVNQFVNSIKNFKDAAFEEGVYDEY